jgi:hypothetical protein
MPSALGDLAQWTPVAFDEGGIDWGDLRGVRFAEPFLTQTVERWAGGDPAPLVRTGFEALRALDGAPSLDPSGFVFHLSRCGSTLVSRLLATQPGTLVVSEPAPINSLLLAAFDDETRVAYLRLLIRALGRRRFGDERHYVLKLSSWNVRHIALFRRAFPATPAVWVQRAPAEVVASLLADPPGWRPAGAAEPAAIYVEALRVMLSAVDRDIAAVDYRDLPDAVWREIAPRFGIGLDDGDIARMRAEACYDSKSAGRRPFAPRAPSPELSEPFRALIERAIEPLYRAIAARQVRADELCGVSRRGMPNAVPSTTTASSTLIE